MQSRSMLRVLVPAVLFLAAAALEAAPPAALAQLPSIRDTARKVLPSVVKIDVVESKKKRQADGRANPFFEYFFDDPDKQREQYYQNESLGSGVIVRKVGTTYYVLTNNHVIEGAQKITVTHDDGRTFDATLVGADPRRDLAVLSLVSSEPLQVINVGDSDSLAVGDWVVAVGSPYGFQSTVTLGIVSALKRRGGPSDTIVDYIQSDAAINKGNSGGALVNLNGELVGINTWISSQGGGSIGLGFAVPSRHTVKVVEDLVKFGSMKPAWLGVAMFSLDGPMGQALPGKPAKGALVTAVYPESPAGKAGMKAGDVILQIGKDPVDSSDAAILAVANATVGEQLALRILRDGKEQKLKLLLAARGSDKELALAAAGVWPAMAVYPLSPELLALMKDPPKEGGLLVRQVISGSAVEKAGLVFGDLLLAVDDVAMDSMARFFATMEGKSPGAAFRLKIWREGKILTLDVAPAQ